MRESVDPRQHLGCDVVVHAPLNPFLASRLGNSHGHDTVQAVRLHVVAHTIGAEVACKEHDCVLGQRDVTQSWVRLLKHGVQHILNWVGTLTELVEHHNHRLACVDTESCVGVVASGLRVVVNHGHCNVTQVHVRHVDVGVVIT